MLPFLQEGFGNANSLHTPGQRAQAAVALARSRVAKLIGADDSEQIIFTSGATEANNQVLKSFASGAFSPFEHSAVREPGLKLAMEVLGNDGLTILPPSSWVGVVSVMSVNNEIGTIWDPTPFAPFAEYLHCDVTQQAGKLPLDVAGLDFASLSAHKFYGPKGVGALYFRDTTPKALIRGGEQEHGLRGGTLNVPGIVGMGAAAQIAIDEMELCLPQIRDQRSVFLEALSGCTDWQINGGEQVSPYILSVSFFGIEGETLVVEADRAGFAISSGAACSSHSTEPSHVLRAMDMDPAWARGTVRVSFGRCGSTDAARDLASTLRQAVENLRRIA